jgi:hypothetical protein
VVVFNVFKVTMPKAFLCRANFTLPNAFVSISEGCRLVGIYYTAISLSCIFFLIKW